MLIRPILFTLFGLAQIFFAFTVSYASSDSTVHSIQKPQRLSEWLQDHIKNRNEIYWLGISWHSQAEITRHQLLKSEVLEQLNEVRLKNPQNQVVHNLQTWIEKLPITGRIPLPQQDPYWLEINPDFDPVVLPQDQVMTPKDPRSITVITSSGKLCTLPHRSHVVIYHYLFSCDDSSINNPLKSTLVVVQPDGLITERSLGPKVNPNEDLSSGSWIWHKPIGINPNLERKIIQLLSVTGASGTPALDEVLLGSRNQIDSPKSIAQHTDKIRQIRATASDWGSTGVLQNPNARMQEEGYVGLSISDVFPYRRYNVMLQPYDWLEFGFRYTDIKNRLYGPADFSGSQSYKDKSVDAKVLLLPETYFTPALALGFRDIVGTGLFSSEYLVANKRTSAFDWSIGIGWGYMSGGDGFKNPLSYLKKDFEQRPANDIGQGGNFSNGYFRGPANLFAGVEYQTPWKDFIFKAELDGNHYKNEPQNNVQSQKTPINLGLVYQLGAANLTLAWERGNQLMLNVHFGGNIGKLNTPKISEPAKVEVAPLASRSNSVSSSQLQTNNTTQINYAALIDDFKQQTGWQILTLTEDQNRWSIIIAQALGQQIDDRIDRAIRVLHRDAPGQIDQFKMIFQRKSLAITEMLIDRQNWVKKRTQLVSSSDKAAIFNIDDVIPRNDLTNSNQALTALVNTKEKKYDLNLGLGYRQTLGGPDGFLLYSLSAAANADVDLWRGGWLRGTLNYRLLDNYDRYQFAGNSELPRVRTYIKEYLTSTPLTMSNLQFTQVGQISPANYVSVYGGYLESMFGGIGAEWLYRPQLSRLALGVDLNHVKQRDFNQDFGFRDYKVSTGHFSQYWDTGWQNLLVKTSIGRYLAGDKGLTVDLSRQFDNGVRIGAYFTKTNVSAQQFGEGSFDKGIYINMPFDIFFTKYSNSDATLLWTSLTRDGGAKLNRTETLYELSNFKNNRLYKKLYE